MSDRKRPTEEGVVEIDAMDESEWEKDAKTPIVHDEQLSKLVKESSTDSAAQSKPRTGATVKRTGTANLVPAKTTAATVKRTTSAKPARTKPATGKTKPPSAKVAASTKPAAAATASASATPAATSPSDGVVRNADASGVVKTGDRSSPTSAADRSSPTSAADRSSPTSAADRSGSSLNPLSFTKVTAAGPMRVATKLDLARPTAAPRPTTATPSGPSKSRPTTSKPPQPPPRSGATPPPLPAQRSAPTVRPRTPSTGLPLPAPGLKSGSVRAAARMPASGGVLDDSDEATTVAPPLLPSDELAATHAAEDAATQVAEPIIIGDIGGDDDLAVPVASGEREPSEAIAALRAAGEIAALASSDANESGAPRAPASDAGALRSSTTDSGPLAWSAGTSGARAASATPASAPAASDSALAALATSVAAPATTESAPLAAIAGDAASATGESAVLASPAASSSAAIAAQSAGDAGVTARRAESGPNPFDEQVWRAEGGSDSEADAVGVRAPLGRRAPVASVIALLRQRRNLAIGAGAAVLLIVIIGFAASGGSSAHERATSDKPAVAKAKTAEPAAAPADDSPASTEPVPEPATTDPAATGSDGTTDEAAGAATGSAGDTTGEPATNPAPPPRPTRRAAPTIQGKRIVLEYDKDAREAKPIANAPRDDQASISRARTSYAAGNTRLFAGDADGAIRNYRQALAYYPAYVAGYRGLGLAYAQKGDKPKAIRALRTYLSTVPRATDAPLIRKRIQMLSR